jgi:hypothetical protein
VKAQRQLPWLAVALLAFAAPAWAQSSGPVSEHPLTFSAGYEALRASSTWFPIGIYVDCGVGLDQQLSVVGEFNDAFRTVTIPSLPTVDLSLSEFVGGVRFSATGSKQARPFVQGLIGLGRARGSGNVNGMNVSASSTAAAYDFGAGADIKAGRRSAVRVAGGLRYIGSQTEFYMKVGIAFPTRR